MGNNKLSYYIITLSLLGSGLNLVNNLSHAAVEGIDRHYLDIYNFTQCTVTVPEVEGYISTQIDFIHPKIGSKHILGSDIHLEMSILVLPSLPDGLMSRLSLCIQLDEEFPKCLAIIGLTMPIISFPNNNDSLGEHEIYAWLQLDNGLKLDCHIPEHDMTRFHIVENPTTASNQGDHVDILYPQNKSTVACCNVSVGVLFTRTSSYHEKMNSSQMFEAVITISSQKEGLKPGVVQQQSRFLVLNNDESDEETVHVTMPGRSPPGEIVTLTVEIFALSNVNGEHEHQLGERRCFGTKTHVLFSTTSFDGINCALPTSTHQKVIKNKNKARAVVTAANEGYIDRLRNLIGSLHFWHGGGATSFPTPTKYSFDTIIYDIGLSEQSQQDVSTWQHVTLKPLKEITDTRSGGTVYGEHVTSPALAWRVAWKPLVILDALKAFDYVIWIDANAELHYPLNDIWDIIKMDGYFFTTAGHLFPTPKTVRPTTLKHFGFIYDTSKSDSKSNSPQAKLLFENAQMMHRDQYGNRSLHSIEFASRVEYTSALMGFQREHWAHLSVLSAMNECCLNETCIWPPDSRGNTNQRRDQSALNAALAQWEFLNYGNKHDYTQNIPHTFCSSYSSSTTPSSVRCWRDKKWWGWAGQSTLQPPDKLGVFDPESIRVFSRRGHPPNLYAEYLEKTYCPS